MHSDSERRVVLRLSTEQLAALGSLFFGVCCNLALWRALATPERLAEVSGWLFLLACAVIVFVLHFLLLLIVLNRWTQHWLAPLLLVATASAVYFIEHYHVFIDPSMLRNVLATDLNEAGDLLAWSMLPYLLAYVVLPLWAWRHLRLQPRRWQTGLQRRLVAASLAFLVGSVALLLVFQEMASAMRNDKGLRYLVTPANYVYSLSRVMAGQAQAAQGQRAPVGEDAQPGTRFDVVGKPLVLVMVVGETARAANWGLSGYARQTTPALAAAGVINFPDVRSCGTNTETSVPCMFSQWGRRHYDEPRIRGVSLCSTWLPARDSGWSGSTINPDAKAFVRGLNPYSLPVRKAGAWMVR